MTNAHSPPITTRPMRAGTATHSAVRISGPARASVFCQENAVPNPPRHTSAKNSAGDLPSASRNPENTSADTASARSGTSRYSAARRTRADPSPMPGDASPAPDGRTTKTVSNAPPRDHAAQGREQQGDVALSDVTIGDSSTFTGTDGATCVYQVTGRRVVDPHLAASEAERFDGEASLFECSPLESPIMQATQGAAQVEPTAPVAPGGAQQKL